MKVVWTATAQLTFEIEQQFILKKWNLNEVLRFIDLVNETILKIKQFPELGILVDDNRHLVISKQTTLIYKVKTPSEIEIQLFWNNKWNPVDFKKYLKK